MAWALEAGIESVAAIVSAAVIISGLVITYYLPIASLNCEYQLLPYSRLSGSSQYSATVILLFFPASIAGLHSSKFSNNNTSPPNSETRIGKR